MEGFKRILVPFDGSEHAKRALMQAVYLARLCGAKLGLLHVVDLNKKISALEQVSTGGYVPGEFKAEGYHMLAEAIKQVPKEIETENVVKIGRPSEVIIDICREGQYDDYPFFLDIPIDYVAYFLYNSGIEILNRKVKVYEARKP